MPVVDGTIITSPYSPLDVPDVDLWSFLERVSQESPDGVALISSEDEGHQLTRKELHQSALSVARGLLNLGCNKSQIVTIITPNCVEYVVICLAVWRLGGIVAHLSPNYTKYEMQRDLELLESPIIVSHQSVAATAAAAADLCNKVKTQIVIGEHPGCTSLSTLLTPDPTWPPLPDVTTCVPCPRDQTAGIYFSSGTTGAPKGTMLTHTSLIHCALCLKSPQVYMHDRSPAIMYQRFFHIVGAQLLLSALAGGRTVVTLQKLELEDYVRLTAKYKSAKLFLAPPIAVEFCASGLAKKYDLSAVQTVMVGGAPIPGELEEKLPQQFSQPIEMKSGYGLTEFPLGTTVPLVGKGYPRAPFGSIGVPFPGTTIKVVDMESRQAVGPNQNGEILMKSEMSTMQGYYKNEEATKNAFTEDGFFITGDVGHFDGDGFLFIVERIKEIIRYKTFQVAPSELEAMLLSHPAVAESGVTGVPAEGTEVPLAWVVLKKGHTATEQDIHNLVKEKLAPYKQLRGGVKFVPSIPKSANGKILRREIKRLSMQ